MIFKYLFQSIIRRFFIINLTKELLWERYKAFCVSTLCICYYYILLNREIKRVVLAIVHELRGTHISTRQGACVDANLCIFAQTTPTHCLFHSVIFLLFFLLNACKKVTQGDNWSCVSQPCSFIFFFNHLYIFILFLFRSALSGISHQTHTKKHLYSWD